MLGRAGVRLDLRAGSSQARAARGCSRNQGRGDQTAMAFVVQQQWTAAETDVSGSRRASSRTGSVRERIGRALGSLVLTLLVHAALLVLLVMKTFGAQPEAIKAPGSSVGLKLFNLPEASVPAVVARTPAKPVPVRPPAEPSASTMPPPLPEWQAVAIKVARPMPSTSASAPTAEASAPGPVLFSRASEGGGAYDPYAGASLIRPPSTGPLDPSVRTDVGSSSTAIARTVLNQAASMTALRDQLRRFSVGRSDVRGSATLRLCIDEEGRLSAAAVIGGSLDPTSVLDLQHALRVPTADGPIACKPQLLTIELPVR